MTGSVVSIAKGEFVCTSLNIHFYEEPSAKTLDLQGIASYLRERLPGVAVDVRRSPSPTRVEDFAWRLAKSRVKDLMKPWTEFEPLPAEVEIEKQLLLNPAKRVRGILYDGLRLQRIFSELLPERELVHVHIIFTNRLFGTYERTDGRYHAHVSVYGYPSLISTTGIVEAPAKPKEFYELRQRYLTLGDYVGIEHLKERFREQLVDYDDPRLTEVLKGYVMQALFHHAFGNPFCERRGCRLYNARWQEEVLEAQLSTPEFCKEHESMLGLLSRRAGPKEVL
jgi:hypothetical protein